MLALPRVTEIGIFFNQYKASLMSFFPSTNNIQPALSYLLTNNSHALHPSCSLHVSALHHQVSIIFVCVSTKGFISLTLEHMEHFTTSADVKTRMGNMIQSLRHVVMNRRIYTQRLLWNSRVQRFAFNFFFKSLWTSPCKWRRWLFLKNMYSASLLHATVVPSTTLYSTNAAVERVPVKPLHPNAHDSGATSARMIWS